MTLHGDIRVNEHKIATWKASRGEKLLDKRSTHTYAVAVFYTNESGTPMIAEFTLDHNYQDGALILAGKILTEAPNYLRMNLHRWVLD